MSERLQRIRESVERDVSNGETAYADRAWLLGELDRIGPYAAQLTRLMQEALDCKGYVCDCGIRPEWFDEVRSVIEFQTRQQGSNSDLPGSVRTEMGAVGPASECKEVIAARERLEPEGARADAAGPSDARNGVTDRRDGHPQPERIPQPYLVQGGWRQVHVPREPAPEFVNAIDSVRPTREALVRLHNAMNLLVAGTPAFIEVAEAAVILSRPHKGHATFTNQVKP